MAAVVATGATTGAMIGAMTVTTGATNDMIAMTGDTDEVIGVKVLLADSSYNSRAHPSFVRRSLLPLDNKSALPEFQNKDLNPSGERVACSDSTATFNVCIPTY